MREDDVNVPIEGAFSPMAIVDPDSRHDPPLKQIYKRVYHIGIMAVKASIRLLMTLFSIVLANDYFSHL